MGASGLTLRLLAVLGAFGLTGCLVSAEDSAEGLDGPQVEDQALSGSELDNPIDLGIGQLPIGGEMIPAGEQGGPTPEPWRGEEDEDETHSGPTPEPWDEGPTPEPWREEDEEDEDPLNPSGMGEGPGSGSPSSSED